MSTFENTGWGFTIGYGFGSYSFSGVTFDGVTHNYSAGGLGASPGKFGGWFSAICYNQCISGGYVA